MSGDACDRLSLSSLHKDEGHASSPRSSDLRAVCGEQLLLEDFVRR